MTVREAKIEDVNQITELFRKTVRSVNSKHYSTEQISHWQASADDIPKWIERIDNWYFIVAEKDKKIVGFAYLNQGNYFDGLFVHHKHQGEGIATVLADEIEEQVKLNGFSSIHSDVSITAKPFFKKRGYIIERLQEKKYRGMMFKNYIVSKKI